MVNALKESDLMRPAVGLSPKPCRVLIPGRCHWAGMSGAVGVGRRLAAWLGKAEEEALSHGEQSN